MKNKRILSFLLAVMILLSSLPFAGITAMAETIIETDRELLAATSHDSVQSTDLARPVITLVENTVIGVRIKWNGSIVARRYRVLRKTNDGAWVAIGDTDETDVIDISVESGNKYTYTVRSIGSDGAYIGSYDTVGKSIKYLDPPIVDTLTNTDKGVQIKWDKVPGAAKYRVFYKTSNGSWTKLADTASTNYTWTDAKSGTEYYFTARCISSDGKTYTSAYDWEGLSIRYIATPKISSISPTADGVQISWGKVNGAEKYRLYYKTESTGWKGIADTTSTNYTWNGANSSAKYTFTVRCISDDGTYYTSGYDNTGKSYSYIASPKITSLTNTTAGVQIVWGKETGAAKYRVFRKTAGGSWTAMGDTTSTSFVDKTAKSNTTYTYTIRCISSDGKTYTSGYDTVGKSVTYIATPKISSATSTATGIQINWESVSGAEKYRLYYKTDSTSWKGIADTTSTSYTWTGTSSGTKYTFTVRCISDDGKRYTSDFDSAGKTLVYVAPPKITELSNTAEGVQINWGKVNGAAKYRVFYKVGNGGWTAIGDTTSTSYTWTGAKSGVNYTFTVRCVSADGKTFTSAYDTAGKSITFVVTPKISSATSVANGVQISWGSVSGAEKYRLYYKTDSQGWTGIADTTSTSYTWTGAKSGTKYTFTVRCVSEDGKSYTSGYDPAGKSLTYIAAPIITSISNTADGIQFSWEKVNGAAKYRVFRKTDGGWTAIGDTTSTSYVDKNVKSGTTYTYTVRCISSDGKSFTSSYDTTGKSITR